MENIEFGHELAGRQQESPQNLIMLFIAQRLPTISDHAEVY